MSGVEVFGTSILGAAILDDTIQDAGAGNDVNQDMECFFWRPAWCMMVEFLLPTAILDDVISASCAYCGYAPIILLKMAISDRHAHIHAKKGYFGYF